MSSKRQRDAFDQGVAKQPQKGRKEGHLVGCPQHAMRQQELSIQVVTSLSSVCELTISGRACDHPASDNFTTKDIDIEDFSDSEEPLASTSTLLLMFEDDALTKKYFKVKANLRQKLMMEFGFGDENDDEQEKEEEFTNSNVTKNDAIVEGDCGCGQQETPARDREKDRNGGHEESTNCQSANGMHTNSSFWAFFGTKIGYAKKIQQQVCI